MSEITFERVAYVQVKVGDKMLNRSESIKVIMKLKHHMFDIGQSVTIDPNDKYEAYIYKKIIPLAL